MLVNILLRPEFWCDEYPDGIIQCEYNSFEAQFTNDGIVIPFEAMQSIVEYHPTGKTVYSPIPQKKPIYIITVSNAAPFDAKCECCEFVEVCTLCQSRCPIIQELYREIYYG